MKRPSLPQQGIVGEVAMREAAAGEFGQIMTLVETSLRTQNPQIWMCVRAYFNDRVIVALDGRTWAYPYTISEANEVAFGARYEVTLDYSPVAAGVPPASLAEAAPTVVIARSKSGARDGTFLEAADKSDKPTRFRVRVIRSGVSLNKKNYPATVLREAVPLFNGVRVFVKGDDEHLKGRGKDVRQLVGRLVDAEFVESAKGAGEIHAVFEALESHPITASIREAVQRGMADMFGLSIDAVGTSTKKRDFVEAMALTQIKSVDLIVEPGAGGQVMSFIEATQESDAMLREQMMKKIRARNAKRADELANAGDEAVLTAYTEALAEEAEANGDGAGIPAGVASTMVTREAFDEGIRMVGARAHARVAIGAAKLPPLAKQRLQAHFDAQTSFREADVDAAIKSEGDYLGQIVGGPQVTGLGRDGFVEAGQDRADKVKQQLDDFFDPSKKASSFREAYVEITGDRQVTGLLSNCDITRLREAAGASNFREAISVSTFADILGDSVARAMLREYAGLEAYQDWRWLVDVVPVNDFRTQERTRLGGYGNLPTVAENGAYAALTSPGDDKATYAATKRGGIETISLETIANDDVGVIRRVPLALATAAGRTLYEFVYDFLATNPVIYDTLALFVAGHNNIGTAALDATSFAASRLRMKKQGELSSNKRLGITLKHLVVPSDLEETAYNLFVRNSNNDESFVNSRKPIVHVVDYWTDANNWYAAADKAQVPMMQIGFYGGNEDPEIFVQDLPTQGSLFSNDQLKWKIRHIYGGAVTDFRGLDGNIVA